MCEFHDRITASESSQILAAVRNSGLISDKANAFLVHDVSRMRTKIRILQKVFPSTALHALAIKANPVVGLLRQAVICGMGLEAASIEEVHLALAAKCPVDRIVFDSPAKTCDEIREALQLGLILNANSFDELDRIESILTHVTSSSRIGLRVNPEVGRGTISHTSVANQSSRFGVSVSSSRDRIFESFLRWDWLRGLHVHVGSQGCGLDMLVDAVGEVNQLRRKIESQTGRRLDFVDIGGGLPAVYRSDQPSLSPGEYAQRLSVDAGDLISDGPPLITEFGRAIQAGCGLTFSRVEYVRPESSTAVIHVGADLFMRPAYAAADWQHEFFALSAEGKVKTSSPRPWTIAGPLCFSGDVIGQNVLMPDVEPGDWIAVRDSGAYTLSMWSRHCSRSIPAVIGYDAGSSTPVQMMREAESPAAVVQFWSQRPNSSSLNSPAIPPLESWNATADGATN